MNQNRQNSMALVSLICGIIGWLGVPLIASVIAIVCGHMARQQIRQTGEEGDQMAVIGMVLGYAHVVIFCLTIGFVVLFYGGVLAFIAAAGIANQ